MMSAFRWWLFRRLSEFSWWVCPEPHKSVLQASMSFDKTMWEDPDAAFAEYLTSKEAGRKEQVQWRPIETAPRDMPVLLYGVPEGPEGVKWRGPVRVSGYYDMIDDAWCATTANWTGPFIAATHWFPLPQPPAESEAGHE